MTERKGSLRLCAYWLLSEISKYMEKKEEMTYVVCGCGSGQ
jgi:hypothetical protein